MHKSFTLTDLNNYAFEMEQMSAVLHKPEKNNAGPGKLAISNILGYSRALNVFNTKMTGTLFLLVN